MFVSSVLPPRTLPRCCLVGMRSIQYKHQTSFRADIRDISYAHAHDGSVFDSRSHRFHRLSTHHHAYVCDLIGLSTSTPHPANDSKHTYFRQCVFLLLIVRQKEMCVNQFDLHKFSMESSILLLSSFFDTNRIINDKQK